MPEKAQLLYSSRISRVRFSVTGNESIVKDSCSHVVSHILFSEGKPLDGGLYNLHLGTTDYEYKCQTCYNKKNACLGHDGHYNLNYPVLAAMTISEIRKWLKLVCLKCGHVIIEERDYMKFPPSIRLDEAQKIARTGSRRCPNKGCNELHPIIKKVDSEPLANIAEYYEDKKLVRSVEIYPHNVKQYLEHISDETVLKMGKSLKSHPRNFVLDIIKIPPTNLRPNNEAALSQGKDSKDITTALQLLFSKNEAIPPVLPPDENIDRKLAKALYELSNSYYDMIKANNESTMYSYSQRLRGKQGRFRGKMLGKRVFDMCRSIIVGDSTLRIDEVGVPLTFAKKIQFEEIVQEYNKRDLMVYVNNGRDKYPGCSEIIKKATGIRRPIENMLDIELEPGDILYRDIITGDYINFNRQPSLKVSNISTMRAVVCEDPKVLTLRMNVISCPLFDADFDGDAMHLIINSSLSTRCEIATLSSVSNWFISHSNSSPSIGQVDDSIIGLFELTKSPVQLDKYHAMMLFNNTTYLPSFADVSDVVFGRDCISKILEETPINFTRKPNYYQQNLVPWMEYDSRDIAVKIDRGKLLSGVLDKASIGKGANGGLYHIICNDYGPNRALEVMYNMQQMAIAYILQYGYTIGIKDLILSLESKREIDYIASDIINKSSLITEKLNNGEIIPPIDMTVEEFYEQQQISALRTADDFIEPILKSINPHTNNLFKLIVCGSKGSLSNMYNMVSSIGQKLINGERIKQKFGYKRTLPYYARHETAPESRGYIFNSYISGMTSPEYIFNAMNARFDIISKALSTSVTGEQNRKSVKNLESIIINNFRFANKHNNIIQFIYGEDGLDPRRVERVKFPTIMMSDTAIKDKYGIGEGITNKDIVTKTTDAIEALIADRNKYREIFLTVENMNINELMTDERRMPVNIERIISDTLREYNDVITAEGMLDLKTAEGQKELLEMIAMVDTLYKNIPYVLINEIQERRQTPIPELINAATWLMTMLLRTHLSIPTLSRIRKDVLQIIIDKVRLIYSRALIDPGTAAGIIAAQSFSGPLTQYVLDAHHRSASGGTSKSGMTRAKEILAARDVDKLESPSMFIRILPEYETDYMRVQEIANNIEVMKLRQFVKLYQVFFEKYGEIVHPDYTSEQSILTEFNKMNPLLKVPGDLIKWCIRIVVDKTTLILKNMTLELIISRLRETFPDLYIVYSPENAQNIILRIYIRLSIKDPKGNPMLRGQVTTETIIAIANVIMDTIIRGVDGITGTNIKKVSRNVIEADGSVKPHEVFGIETTGTNFHGMMANKYINPLYLQTDAVLEVYRMLGIEAARQKLISELRTLVDSCNHRHYLVYADEMTMTGRVTSIERSGLSIREESNYLLRIGFSSPIQTLEEAGIDAAIDEVTGVTGPLLVGSIPKVGTLYNSIHVDPKMVTENLKRPDDIMDIL